jgi:putative phage-type endonuclease
MIQGSEEWHLARLGKVTASCISDVMAEGRNGKPSVTRANYEARLVAERLSGRPTETFQSAAMNHGVETEGQARACYSMETGNAVEQVGLVDHPVIGMAAASPDGMVGDEGLVEIKCPNTATHIQTILTGKIASDYIKQMQFQMACTGRRWCDFVSFDPRMPDNLQLHIIRVSRDESMIAEIETAVREFLGDVATTIRLLSQRAAA